MFCRLHLFIFYFIFTFYLFWCYCYLYWFFFFWFNYCFIRHFWKRFFVIINFGHNQINICII